MSVAVPYLHPVFKPSKLVASAAKTCSVYSMGSKKDGKPQVTFPEVLPFGKPEGDCVPFAGTYYKLDTNGRVFYWDNPSRSWILSKLSKHSKNRLIGVYARYGLWIR